jgi:hypothetical protein
VPYPGVERARKTDRGHFSIVTTFIPIGVLDQTMELSSSDLSSGLGKISDRCICSLDSVAAGYPRHSLRNRSSIIWMEPPIFRVPCSLHTDLHISPQSRKQRG